MSSRLMLSAAGGMLWTAVCLWMALAAPRMARGDEPAVLFTAQGPADSGAPLAPAAPGLAAPLVGDANCPHYWIVSSRCASQSFNDGGPCNLDYFEHRPDGSLCRTNAAAMASQFLPGVPVCVFIHGSFVSWEDNQQESHQTYLWIRRACPNRPLHVVFFTWPSDRMTALLVGCEVLYRGVQAEYNAFHVTRMLSQISDCQPVCLVGHSYGARIAMGALHLAAGGDIEGHRTTACVGRKRMRAVLAAAALDHQWLNDCQRYERALCRAECVLNLRNRHDLALKTYNILRPFARRALGASGVTWWDRNLQTCTATIQDYDVSSLIGCGHYWPNYFGCPAIASAISSWVYFPDCNPGYGTYPASPPVASLPDAVESAPPAAPEGPAGPEASKPAILPEESSKRLLPPPVRIAG